MNTENAIYGLDDKVNHLLREIRNLKLRVRALETYSDMPARYKEYWAKIEQREEEEAEE